MMICWSNVAIIQNQTNFSFSSYSLIFPISVPHRQLNALGHFADVIEHESMFEYRFGRITLHGRPLEARIVGLRYRQQCNLDVCVYRPATGATQIPAAQNYARKMQPFK